jgi:FemAB-related protein (PEP-CTERM system-associated)
MRPSDRDSAAWDAYVETHPSATGDHLWAWQHVIEGVFGQRCTYLMARQAGVVTGVLPLVLFRSRLFGKMAISMPFLNYGGILADDEQVARLLAAEGEELARAFGAAHLELRHRERQLPAFECRQHRLGFQRDLPDSAEALWSATDRKVRNQVRKAQKEGLAARTGGIELVDAFYSVFSTNMRDLGTPVYPRALFTATLSHLGDRARVHVVSAGDRVVAGSISVRFRDVVLVPWASSLREFRAQCPNMLLYWHMLETAVAQGARVFDFGRSAAGGGPHQFKLQWGAREVPLHWEYARVASDATLPSATGADHPSFRRAVEVWKRLPLPVANFLGPWIVRGIP